DLDEALLSGAIDLAVHSAKDLPETPRAGLDWSWLPWKEDRRDVLVCRRGESPESLKPGARVGVSSERRIEYCRRFFPSCEPAHIRGNVDERVRLLDKGLYDMIILAARPSVGKTAFCLNIASHICTALGKGCILFSLEMAKEQLVQRLLCMAGQVDSSRLRSGFLARAEFPKLQHAAQVLSQAPLFIDDTPNMGILEMRSKARRHKAQGHPLDLVIIDYLQLMHSDTRRAKDNRQQEIAEISSGIKALAKELEIPIIVLAQLNREIELWTAELRAKADVVDLLDRPAAPLPPVVGRVGG
ncbi:MAG: AAA family ATPase, partial [Thermoanaerobaculia bacterium]|nr:AAA family ATPase [Thermoanaerobaculia bacterium]